MRFSALIALALACSPSIDDSTDADADTDTDTDTDADTDTDTDTDNADPDVQTYFPDGYSPAAPTTVIIFGDSIAAGGGADTREQNFVSLLLEDGGSAWQGYEDIDLESLYGDLRVIDVSVGGARSADVPSEQLPNAEDQLEFPVEGEVIVLGTIGGNDLAQVIVFPGLKDSAVQAIDDGLNAVVSWVQDAERFPDGAYLYLTNVYDPSDGVGQADGCFTGLDTTAAVEALGEANAASRAMAEDRGVSWVDMHGHFLGHGHNYDDDQIDAYDADDPSIWFYSDCIHPNNRGHHEIRRLFFHAIANETLPLDIPG